MKNKWSILTSLLLVLLVVQTPQFGQNTSTDPRTAHRHELAINLLRAINTAEVPYHSKNGSYAAWQTLLSSEPKYFDDFLARQREFFVNFGQPDTVTSHILPTIQFKDPPEIPARMESAAKRAC
jgi:hypothetical protein